MQDQVVFLMINTRQLPMKFFNTMGINVKGIHEFISPKEAIKNAQGIFTGGGNTFLLIKQLYHL